MTAGSSTTAQRIVTNRKALRDYEVLERFEAGVSLFGPEVKSIRNGDVDLTGGFAAPDNGELMLYDVRIAPYAQCHHFKPEPSRPRRLLMRKRQILSLGSKADEKGLTIVPLKLYFKRGWIKVELGLCRGKKTFDKRDTLRRRTAEREVARATAGTRR